MQFLGQRRHALLIQQPILRRKDARADFHNPGAGGGGNFLAKDIGHFGNQNAGVRVRKIGLTAKDKITFLPGSRKCSRIAACFASNVTCC